MTTAAQDFSSLLEKFEHPAKGQGLDWKLSRKELKEKSSSYHWEANGGKGYLTVTSTGS